MSISNGFTISIEQQNDYQFLIKFDDTDVSDLLTDEPPPLGKGEGPNPSRMLAAAVANCMAASLLFAMRKYKNNPGPMTAKASAQIGRNEAGRWRVQKIDIDLQLAELAGAHEQLQKILEQFEDFCVVTQSVRTGVEVNARVRDAAGVVLNQKN